MSRTCNFTGLLPLVYLGSRGINYQGYFRPVLVASLLHRFNDGHDGLPQVDEIVFKFGWQLRADGFADEAVLLQVDGSWAI